MADTVDAINEIAVSVDADLKAQREAIARRQRFAIAAKFVIDLERCPDWPVERITEYAHRRTSWTLADIIEDGLAALLPPADAVWLVLSAELLQHAQIKPFVVTCAVRALGYIDYDGAKQRMPKLSVLPANIAAIEAGCWSAVAVTARAIAIELDRPHHNTDRRMLAIRYSRVKRLAELAYMVASPATPDLTSAALRQCAMRAGQLAAMVKHHGMLEERRAQLVHLLQLVT